VSEEARIEDGEHGRVPADAGWWILNLAEIAWEAAEGNGIFCTFEAPSAPSPDLGLGVHVLHPGEPNGMYHAEDTQEGFLVLQGECVAIVEGQERRMRQWDYFHCPPGTAHITVGAGDGPCAILMAGVRRKGRPIHYPVDELAARAGASVATPTDSPREAYADLAPVVPARSPWPLEPM
jgi:quercetin dioxygenase-like cupin family protein